MRPLYNLLHPLKQGSSSPPIVQDSVFVPEAGVVSLSWKRTGGCNVFVCFVLEGGGVRGSFKGSLKITIRDPLGY